MFGSVSPGKRLLNTTVQDQNALNKQIGQMSFWMLIAGFLGSSCIGIILDKTKKFRIITLSVTVLYCALYSIFTIFVVEGN